MIAVRLENVTKEFGEIVALDEVTISIEKGEIYGLLGRNGAGKTTLLRIIAGQAFATRGKTEISQDTQNGFRQIGSLIDGAGAFLNLSGYKNLLLFASLVGESPQNVKKVLDLVGLSDAAKRRVSTYSLGMKQRLGLAIALLGNPPIIVLDEPFNGLDPLGVRMMSDLIIRLNIEENKTFVISSHMLGELERITTRCGFIDQGRLIEELTREEVEQGKLEEYFLEKVGYENSKVC